MPQDVQPSRRNAEPPPIPDVGAWPFYRLVYGLFFYPHIVLFALHHQGRLGRALRLLTVLCLLCGGVLGLVRLPGILKASQDWADWLAREAHAVWIDDGALRWEFPKTLPYTTRHRGWRVDFVSEGTPFRADRLTGPERQGVWVGPEKVLAWWREARDRLVLMTIVSDRKAGGFFEMRRLWPNGSRLEGVQIPEKVRQFVLQSVPILILHEGLSVFLAVLLYTVIFSLITVLMRSPLGVRGFKSALTFHLFASIPPVVVACVYSGLDLPYLDLSTAFVCAFVVYLVLTMSAVNRQAEDGRRDAS